MRYRYSALRVVYGHCPLVTAIIQKRWSLIKAGLYPESWGGGDAPTFELTDFGEFMIKNYRKRLDFEQSIYRAIPSYDLNTEKKTGTYTLPVLLVLKNTHLTV